MEYCGKEVRLTAHQATYLSWLGLFDKIAHADLFCLFDVCQYERKSFENRNIIKTNSGLLMLTVPVESKGHFETKGKDVKICPTGWARKHLRSIELAYSKAPYYDAYIGGLESILTSNYEYLADLNLEILRWGMKSFGIKTPIVRASDYDFQGVKSGLVLDMCLKLGASEYVFGALGSDYADKEAFAEAGVGIEFQDYNHPVYPQLFGQFAPYVSFIDLLLNCGPNSRRILIN